MSDSSNRPLWHRTSWKCVWITEIRLTGNPSNTHCRQSPNDDIRYSLGNQGESLSERLTPQSYRSSFFYFQESGRSCLCALSQSVPTIGTFIRCQMAEAAVQGANCSSGAAECLLSRVFTKKHAIDITAIEGPGVQYLASRTLWQRWQSKQQPCDYYIDLLYHLSRSRLLYVNRAVIQLEFPYQDTVIGRTQWPQLTCQIHYYAHNRLEDTQ